MPFVRPFFSWSGGCAFAAVVGYFIVVAAISSSRVRSSSFLSRGAVVRRRPGCVEVDRGARLARVRSGPDGVEDVIGIDRVEYGWKLYAPDAATRDNPYVSPLRASTEELKGLPPALVITAERSVARRRRSLCTQAQRGWRCGDRHPL